MSLWTENRGRTWPFFVGLGCLVVAIVGGLLLMTANHGNGGSAQPPSDAASSASPTASPTATPAADGKGPRLTVTSWGRSAGQLALVVRNDSKKVITQARLLIVARDASGVAVLTSTGTPTDVCCSIVGLAPGQRFGLFTDLGSQAGDIKSVTVQPVDSTVKLGKGTKTPAIKVGQVRMQRLPADTVVDATVTATGQLSGYVAVQAVLVDDRGSVAQVVSGRFYCFRPGHARKVRLHLFHAVPKGLKVGKVLTQSIPAGVKPGVPGKCG